MTEGQIAKALENAKRGQSGMEYQVLHYKKQAQEFLVESLRERWKI